MSTPILDVPADTTGWLLEMTGTGDTTAYTAVAPDGRHLGYVFFIAFDKSWRLAVPGVGLPSAPFDREDDAVAWLTHLANLCTRPGA